MSDLKNKTAIITGASRGIGAAMAERLGKEGANVVIIAKTSEPNPKLKGTIHETAEAVEKAGGKALALQCDIRDAEAVQEVVDKTVETFGGIDILINNAGALSMLGTLETSIKKFDLLLGVNVRATFAMSRAALPHLFKSDNPHIINVCPPLNMNPKWFTKGLPYTITKYGMSMCVLGMSQEFKSKGVAVNGLWPETTIATAAVEVNFPEPVYQCSRSPDVMADAAYWILSHQNNELTGQFFTDESALKESGVTDLTKYALDPSKKLVKDFYLD